MQNPFLLSSCHLNGDYDRAISGTRLASNIVYLRTLSKEVGFNSRFPTYSITKTFIAVAILKQVERGALGLEDPVAKHLSRFPFDKRITVRQLLNHTAGIPDYGSLSLYHDDLKVSSKTPWTEERFEQEALQKGLLFKPGKGWSYSNTGYMYLKILLSQAFTDSLQEALAKLIFDPLELKQTEVADSIESLKRLLPAHSTSLSEESQYLDIRENYHPHWCAPGLVTSSSMDILQFFGTICDTEFIPRELFQEMITPVKAGVAKEHTSFWDPCYGLGLMIDPANPRGLTIGHGGCGPGYSLSLMARLRNQENAAAPTRVALVMAAAELPDPAQVTETALSLLDQID